MVEESVLETVRKAVEDSKKDLEEAKTAIELLEAMDVDVKSVKKSYEDAKTRVETMEKAYSVVAKTK